MIFPPLLRDSSGNIIPQIWDGANWQPYKGQVEGLEALALLIEGLSQTDYATDAKLEAVRGLVEAISQKGFATETTLAQALEKQDTAKLVLDAISSAVAAAATEQTLTEIRAALTDGTQKVALTGNLAPSRKRVVDVSLSPGTSIATGAYETTTIRCSAGALASMRDFYFRVAAVPGATQGTHTAAVSTPTPSGEDYTLVVVSAPYNETLKIARDSISSVGVAGFRTREEWIGYLNSGSCVFGPDAASQISVWYHNGTDAAQTKARSIHYRALEEAVTW